MKQKLLFFLACFFSVTLAHAQQFVDNGIKYNVTSATVPYTVEVIANSPIYSGSVNIPSNVTYNSNTYTVTSIGDQAFYACSGLTSVTIPNSITSIGFAAFTGCSVLSSVTIPNTVASISAQTFNSCFALTSVTIGNSVSSIGDNAFANCSGLTSIFIPNSVSSIGIGAFGSCSGLTSVTVEWQNPISINQIVFWGVNINSATLNIPAGTTSLYDASPVWTEFNIVEGAFPAPRGCWAEVSAGGFHTLAIAQDGTLWSWGDNNYKQLGNNSPVTYQTTPIQISSERNWMFVSAGEYYSLAIKKDGTLWAWGRNSDGQLGDGTTTQRNTPVQIGTDTNWLSINAGYHHTMAIKANNTLWAWGRNTNGQIGNGNTTQQNTPVQVGTATDWAMVKPGRNHTLALKSNGQLWSWGQNTFGQLGQGNYTSVTAPLQVGTATDWKFIQAGDYHSLVLKTNGTIWAWGDNASGQLGIGNTTEQTSPVQLGTATDWKIITSGAFHGYGIKTNGTLWSWGDNYFGQVGIGNFTQQNSPIQVGTATDWYSIFSGDYYGVSQKNNGNFMSWGDNQSGQLGNGNTTPNTTGQNIPGGMNCSGNILAFDGIDDRVVIQNLGTGILGDNSANESYTFVMKVKIASVGATPLLSKKSTTPSNQGFSIETDASGVVFFDQAYGGVFRRVQSSSPLVANVWYTISATFDYPNKTHKLYINGNEVATFTDTSTPQFVAVKLTIGMPEGSSPSSFSTSFKANLAEALNVPLTRLEIVAISSRNNQSQQAVQPENYLFKYQFNQGIANAINTGITTMQNEVLGSPYVGTLENFALSGSASNWSYDNTAFETLNTNEFLMSETVKVYPNPSKGIFTISLEEDADVRVHDMLGKVIYSNKVKAGNNAIDISSYQAGLYLLNLKSERGSITKKLIKE